jgi:hypothetical protein
MLNLSRRPDVICVELLNTSFALAVDMLKLEGEEYFYSNFHNVSRVFSLETAVEEWDKLRFFNQIPGVFGINEYHYALIYDALTHHCNFNKGELLIEGTKIYEIDMDLMIQVYFWCEDFDYCLQVEIVPTIDDLENKEIEEEDLFFLDEIGPHFGPYSTKYPDLQYPEMLVRYREGRGK